MARDIVHFHVIISFAKILFTDFDNVNATEIHINK